MKRAMPWNDEDEDSTSSDESSTVDTDPEDNDGSSDNITSSRITPPSKPKPSQVDQSMKRKRQGIHFDALSRHGYKGGLSVLNVPPPKDADDQKQDWSWSTGKESRAGEIEETYEERQRTRAAIVEGEQLTDAQTQKEKRNLSFSQKEKRKRDLGQASRGKNYVEEEKRLLRDNGIYSGFDS